jgi:hypothetical protein
LYTQQSTQIGNGRWANTATFSGCIYSFTVTLTANNVFGADATFCAPKISLLEISTTLEINNNSLTSVLEIQPINASSTSSEASLSQNVTEPPMNGQAFNGISFNLTNPDELTIQKSNATTLQLSASILQVAAKAPGGLQAALHNNNFTEIATMIYVSD